MRPNEKRPEIRRVSQHRLPCDESQQSGPSTTSNSDDDVNTYPDWHGTLETDAVLSAVLGDELFSDSYEITEVEDGFFYEVEGKWVVLGAENVDIGANPSAEGGDDEAVDDTERRAVDLVDAARLQEQPPYDKKTFMAYVKGWVSQVLEKLPEEKKDEFKAKSTPAVKFLLSKLKDLQLLTCHIKGSLRVLCSFSGESMDTDGTMVYAYYKEGASNPTFLFPVYALEEMKC